MSGPTMNVGVRWKGGRRYEVSQGSAATIVLDGERVAGPGPVATLLGALASCSAMDIVDYLEKRRTPVTRMDIAVSGVRNATVPQRVLSARLEFTIDGDGIEAEHAERSIALAFGTYCSVAATLAPDVEIATRLVLNGVAREDVMHRRSP